MTTDQVVVTSASVFAVSARSGDIHPRTKEGFYAYDTRFLSALRLLLEEREPEPVGAGQFDHSIASFYASSRRVRGLPSTSVSIVRDRYVGDGLHEDITLVNHSDRPRRVHLKVAFDADFADVFQVRLGPVRKAGRITVESREGQHLCLVYRRGAFQRETWVAFSATPRLEGKTAEFDVLLEPKTPWRTCMAILPVMDTPPPAMRCVGETLGSPYGAYRIPGHQPLRELRRQMGLGPLEKGLPQLDTDHSGLRLAYYQAPCRPPLPPDGIPTRASYSGGRAALVHGCIWPRLDHLRHSDETSWAGRHDWHPLYPGEPSSYGHRSVP